MKRFWLKILLLAPLPLIVVGFNWFVDPVHLRDADQYEYGIAHLILQGKRVTNIYNPNEALYLKHYVGGLSDHKEVLVLGSSRSKLIRSDAFPDMSFFNNSIGGAGLVDYLAVYEMYRRKKLTPSIAVLELSPWILQRDYASVWHEFNDTREELERQVLPTSHARQSAIRTRRVALASFSDFLSLGYFQTSFYTWLEDKLKPTQHHWSYYTWEDGTVAVGETLLADGSTIYPERIQNQKEQEHVTALAIDYGQKPIGIPEELDVDHEKLLEAFLDHLQQDGVRAVLYLPPYHPRTYAMMTQSQRYRIILEIQQYYEALARRKGLTLIGSYNPADVPLDATAFFDGSHPTPEAVRAMFVDHVPGVHAPQLAKQTPAVPIEVGGVQNPNGLEVVNGKPFFWMGDGDTCVSVRSAKAGVALITFHADPGPSLPQTPQRTLFVGGPHGYSRTVLIKPSPEVAISFPVAEGPNTVCLTPLDKPTVLEQPNGDKRPLLIGVSNLQIKLLPDDAVAPDHAPTSFQFASGWHPVEHDGPDWLCWTAGRGRLSVQVEKDTTVILAGEILSLRRPNNVDLIVNGARVKTFAVNWTEWAFRSFEPLRLTLKPGQNSIEFVSENPPIVQQADPRPLAVAIKNVTLTEVSAR